MKKRKLNAVVFMTIALVFGISFYLNSVFPQNFDAYFKPKYYGQFGPIAICVELFIAGIYLYKGDKKSNFALALFAFTSLLDPIFNLAGLFGSNVPIYATIIFVVCSIWSLYLAFSNTYNLGRISLLEVIGSFVLGVIIELSFNYFFQFW
ncbi:hypothetical protein J4E06_15625 [Muricauda sp. NFXS6]|uniref:hypothetical protein n=1 Tax=Allomuricauda sp. NFXS6 TaxID=2819094 RepID=UPI002CF42C31|nr:hypothetical protein [Allomuricauda sp.]|tara:strand:+ start:4731 stop:5180 length:450 start_codon:yes stop_codon:yes gene_type:complete